MKKEKQPLGFNDDAGAGADADATALNKYRRADKKTVPDERMDYDPPPKRRDVATLCIAVDASTIRVTPAIQEDE